MEQTVHEIGSLYGFASFYNYWREHSLNDDDPRLLFVQSIIELVATTEFKLNIDEEIVNQQKRNIEKEYKETAILLLKLHKAIHK